MPRTTAHLAAARRAERTRLIEAGELIPNAAFRDRVLFLQAHDPEFSLTLVCLRLADHGYPNFLKAPTGTKRFSRRGMGDTSHLERLLGMRDPAPSRHNGRRYENGRRTEYLSYDFAVALCRALDMDPVDVGV
jgi:hypothetical protein